MRNKTSKWLKNLTPEQQMKLYNFRYWWVTSLWGGCYDRLSNRACVRGDRSCYSLCYRFLR